MDRSLAALSTQAIEDPHAGAVLHDALLERWPALYAPVVRAAIVDADAFQECVQVRVDIVVLAMHEQRATSRMRRVPRGSYRGGQWTPGSAPRLKPFAYRHGCDDAAGWTPATAITFTARSRRKPRARVYFDGVRRAYDAVSGETLALRQRADWRSVTGRVPSPEDLNELDQALIRRVKTELGRRWPKSAILAWHEWNDRNGDFRGATKSELITLLMEIVEDERATPREMGERSRRAGWPP